MNFTSGCSIAVGFHPQLKTRSVCCVETRMKALVYQIMLTKKKKIGVRIEPVPTPQDQAFVNVLH